MHVNIITNIKLNVQDIVQLIDSESEDDHKILVVKERDLWADMFHKVNV